MIRRAGIEDFDRIMEMMINFANASPFGAHHAPQYNEKYVKNLLVHIIKNGVIIVGETKGKVQGMLIGVINEDPWLPHVKYMKEIAWWVEEEHRLSSLGYKLLKKYIEYGEKMKDADIIQGFTLTNMEISPDFDLEKRGWKPMERNYLYEGVG
jgi:hypothetical protein